MQLIRLFACLPLIHFKGKEAGLVTGKETQFGFRVSTVLLDRALIHNLLYMSKQAYSNILDEKTKNKHHQDQRKVLKFHTERHFFSLQKETEELLQAQQTLP